MYSRSRHRKLEYSNCMAGVDPGVLQHFHFERFRYPQCQAATPQATPPARRAGLKHGGKTPSLRLCPRARSVQLEQSLDKLGSNSEQTRNKLGTRTVHCASYSLASGLRPCASWIRRLLTLYKAPKARNWLREISTSCSKMNQRTPSVQGGAVSEPSYVQ